MSKSPTKAGAKGGTDSGAATAVELARDIKYAFESLLGTDYDVACLDEEYHNLLNHDRIKLQSEANIFEARKARRIQRRDELRRKEEEQRLWERRNNPENLAACARSIQTAFRRWVEQSKFHELAFAYRDRNKKRAVIICIDGYEDRRVRMPSIVTRDGLEMARWLQIHGFQVDFLSTKQSSALRPTRANILEVLHNASRDQGSEEGVIWVHICGAGGIATVSGRNPHKVSAGLNADGTAVAVTPRTRLLKALKSYPTFNTAITPTSSSTSPAAGASAASAAPIVAHVGDQCHYVLPCDSKSVRLNFDSVITDDDVLDVLFPRPQRMAPSSPTASSRNAAHVHSTPVSIYGRSLLQRIVTMDIAPLGLVEGSRGAGFGLFSSSVTPTIVIDYPTPPSPLPGAASSVTLPSLAKSTGAFQVPTHSSTQLPSTSTLIEPHRAILSHLLLRALLGVGWKPISPINRAGGKHAFFSQQQGGSSTSQQGLGPRRSSMAAAPSMGAAAASMANASSVLAPSASIALLDNDSPGLTAKYLADHLVHHLTDLQIEFERSGRQWGDFTIVPPERGAVSLAFIDKVVSCTTATNAGEVMTAAAASASTVSQMTALANRMRRRKPPATLRQLTGSVTVRVDVTRKEGRVNCYDADLLTLLPVWLHLMSQSEPNAPVPKQPKLLDCRVPPQRRLTIGVAASFVEISHRCKARGTTDAAAWQELLSRLLRQGGGGAETVHANQRTQPTVATPTHAGSRSGGASVASPPDPRATTTATTPPPQAEHIGGATPASPTHAPLSRRKSMASPLGNLMNAYESQNASPSPGSGPAQPTFQLWVGKPEEGGVAFVLDVATHEELFWAISNAESAVPESLCGVPLHSVFVDVRFDCQTTVNSFEHLAMAAHGACVTVDQLGIAGAAHPSVAFAVVNPSVMPISAEEALLGQMAAHHLNPPPKRTPEWLARIAYGNLFRVLKVDPWLQRLNDLDDGSMDAFARRERPAGNACHVTHNGVAICVIATNAASLDQRLQQCAEFAPFAEYELMFSVRCLLWDMTEPISGGAASTTTTTGASATSSVGVGGASGFVPLMSSSGGNQPPKKERLCRLLDSLKENVPAASFPCLLILDLNKKRYYRCALSQGATLYSSSQIAHFIDAFVRGSLNDLLPPVKGCRVYGGAHSRNKYTLIPV